MNDVYVIITGVLVASVCSLLGCFLILRRMALIGDAISHSVLPGIVVAFMLQGSRDSLLLMFGASLVGLVTVYLIQLFKKHGVHGDASLGVVFTSLFAVGLVLVSLYTRHIDLDLDCVLFGEIAYVPFETTLLFGLAEIPKAIVGLGITLLIVVAVLMLFYKQFKISSFDPALAAALGIPVGLFHYLLMGMVSLSTVASFESVGVILVVGMLIVPAATAYLLTERLGRMLLVSVAAGALSALLGYGAAYALDASISGSMISAAGGLFVLALLFSPRHGVLLRRWRRRGADGDGVTPQQAA